MESVLTPPASEPSPELSPSQLTFHLEEYKSLRAEIAVFAKSSVDVFLYAVIASGGISAWLITQKAAVLLYGPFAMKAAAMIPIFVTVVAYTWSRTFTEVISAIAGYQQRVEKRIAADGLGWETYLLKEHKTIGAIPLPRRQMRAWAALLVANLIFLGVA